MAVVPLYLNSLDADAKAPAAGIFFALLGLAITISTYGAGVLAGRLRPQAVFLLGASGAAAGSLLISFAGSVPLVLGLSVVLGLGTGVLLTSSSAMIGLVSPPDRQGFAFGMVQSASALGFGFGPLMGGVFANFLGLHAPFLVQGAIFLALLPLVLIVGRSRGQGTGQPV
jgi:MFS family permease